MSSINVYLRDIPDRAADSRIECMSSWRITLVIWLAVASLKHALEDVITLLLRHMIRKLNDNTMSSGDLGHEWIIFSHVQSILTIFKSQLPLFFIAGYENHDSKCP